MHSLPLRTSILLGALYFATLPWQPYPGSVAVKGLSIALLAWVAWAHDSRLLALGLALSAVGDVLLDIRSVNLFVAGLSAFLLAHLLYTTLFLQSWPRPRKVWEKRRVLAGSVLVYAVLFGVWLAPSLGPLGVPVAVYICAITAMVMAAIVAGLPSRVVAGAILFLVSDSLLAAGKFKGSFPLRDFLVWGTYYLAQFSIATGVLQEKLAPLRNWRSALRDARPVTR